jgi:hypothetical protein
MLLEVHEMLLKKPRYGRRITGFPGGAGNPQEPF